MRCIFVPMRVIAKSLSAVCLGLLAVTVAHAQQPDRQPDRLSASTRLVHCGAQTCVLVKGMRGDAQDRVAINGHAIAVEGTRHWQVAVPLESLRAWSAPYARAITLDVGGQDHDVRLPIGVLGGTTDLALLEVRVH